MWQLPVEVLQTRRARFRRLYLKRLPGFFPGVVGLLALLAGLYWSGLLTSGWERRTIVNVPPSTFRNQGTRLGSRTVFVRAGESVQIEYQATIKHGGLHIRLWKNQTGVMLNPVGQVQVYWSNQGSLVVPIYETGFYRISCDGLPAAHGYDLSYEVSWRVRGGGRPI